MKKRICSLLIVFSMIAALWPQITLPQAAAADGTTTAESKVDAFGLPTEIDDSLKTNDLSKNPYGTKGWIPLFQNHELVVAGVYDDEFQTTYEGAADGTGKQMSSFRWSNSTEMGNINRLVNVAFDPYGTGRDEYIATLAFDDRADRLRLYVTNKDRKVVNSIDLCGDDVAFINELKFYQTRAMLCLTAGDFDGDGKDTVMVYVPGNNSSETAVDSIHEFSLNGNTLTDKGQKINLGDVLNQGRAGLKAMLYHDGNGINELRAHLSVDMEAGDVDLDGIEELAMTVNVNELKKDSYGGHDDFERSYLAVYEGDTGNWSQKMKRELVSQNGGAKGRARFAGVTIGNFSNAPSDGVAPEVIAVGFYENKDNYHTCEVDSSDLRLYSYQYQTDGTWTEKYKAERLYANGFTSTGTKDDEIQNPVAVAAVSADGAMTQEYLFVSGSMYKVGNSGIERCGGDSDMGKNRGIGGYIINNTGILDYAVGNFDGNKQGREQVYYVEYHKQETFDKEFLRIGQLYKEDVVSGETHTASENFKRWTDGWTYYGKKNCNVAITAADVNNDAVLAKIKEISYGYTNPKIMAILEASPHFSELDSFGNSATSFGQKVGDQTGVSASGSFGFDVMAGFEYVAPLIETGGGIEFNTSHTFTVGGGTTTTKEVEIKYANDNAEENSVVMYAMPMTYYLYDVKYPDDTPQKESTMMLSVAMKPVTSIVSVDTYNEAAAAYADMDQIGANIQLGTPGQPNTYRAGLPKAGDEHSWKYGEPKQYYGTDTITESITQSKEKSYNFNYEYEGSVQAYGIAGGFKAGGGYHWGVSTGIEKVSTEGLTKEGAVNCQNDPRYNFNWEFATWTVSLNGDDVPVLGYLVNNVVAPPSPAENLRLSEQTTDSMVLSWDSGARPAEYYKIYRYIENNKDNPFILVDTVDASEAASGSYEYKLTGLAANTEYKYAITSGCYKENNESVESEIVAGKTLASDMERPTITGPNKDVRAPLGESATFSVKVSGPAVYKSFLYRWQKREVGGKWENISDATSNTYTVDKVTSELNGAMFRCVVTGLTSSSEPIPFYSDAATLTVGMPTAEAALDVAGHKDGEGTKEKPYIGQSDYLTIGTGTPVKETKITSYTATAADGTKLSVYEVDKTNDYIGIGTDASGNTVYYSVTANADGTFTAGAELNESTVYTWQKDGATLTVPAGTSPDTALTKELVSAGEKTTYYQAVVLDAAGKPTEYLYQDGEIYNTDGTKATGMDNVKPYLVHNKTDSQYILSRDETTSSAAAGSETEGAGDTTETKYYELAITTTPATEEGGAETTTYTLSALTYTAEHKIGSYTDPTFTLHQTETQETVIPETRTAGIGTALSLTTTTKNISNNNAPLSVDYTLTITNTSTGTVSTLTGKTDTNGTDTKLWRAPIAGLYAITTTTAGGTASEPQYYLAGVQTVRKTEESETVYTLDSAISGVYSSPVALTTRQQTIKKTGDTISAEASAVVDDVTYTYRLSSSAATETNVNGASFDAPKAGTYVVSAYDKDGKKLASTTINIKRKPVTLSIVLPGDTAGAQTYDAPAHKSEITFTGTDQLKSGDKLPDGAILINCDLYDSNGDKRDTSGRFDITLSLNNGENAPDATKQTIAGLLEKYEFTFVSRKVISEQQTGTVAYSVGEGGKVVARKGAGGSIFNSGTVVAYGAVVTFDAYPDAGHMVKEWLVNGAAVSGSNYEISADRKRLTVKSFSGSDLVDDKLTVEVRFGSDSHKITFSAGAGGSLTAALADGNELENEQNVLEGSTVTFTAAPDGSRGVKSWTVDGNPYYWPGTTNLYRETTLTLENISADRTVQVAFTDGDAATHTITTGYTTENAETVTGVSISAKLASGADAVLTAVPDGAAVTFTVNGLTSNHTVKEWLVDGQTAAGSGGQTSFTLRDITANHTVKAVIAVATAHTLTFRAVDAAGDEITDPSIAKLTATSNGTPLTSNSKVEAYKQIDFSVAVGENYLKNWLVNNKETAKDGNTLTVGPVRQETTIVAVFDELVRQKVMFENVTKMTGSASTVDVTADGKPIKPGATGEQAELVVGNSKIVFEATVPDNEMVGEWTINGVKQANLSNTLTIDDLKVDTKVTVKFVPYKGYDIPTGRNGYEVTKVIRTPDDTKPDTQIRENGDLTFTVGANAGTDAGQRIGKLIVNGYDCVAGKLAEGESLSGCESVSAVRNADGSYTVTIKNVTGAIQIEAAAHKLVVGGLKVPDNFLTRDDLDTVEKIRTKLQTSLTGSSDGMAFYDIALMMWDTAQSKWIAVTEANFPKEGVDVVLAYPTGTDSKDTFQIVHMLTKTGQEGKVERVAFTKQTDGLHFHVDSLSPFGVSWVKYTTPTPDPKPTPGGGGGGGGGVVAASYDIVIPSDLKDTVKSDKTKASEGETVTLTVSGGAEPVLSAKNGKTVALTNLGGGKFSFKMPASEVTVSLKTSGETKPCDGGANCPARPYTDVDTAQWYHASVDYVLTNGIMNGTSATTFVPNGQLTRGMLVQILYNLEGKPQGGAAAFDDVASSAWYAKAVGWAAENKIVGGYGDGRFGPNDAVTREQTAAILYRYAQSKGVDVSVGEDTNILSFTDAQSISEYAIPAMQWAVGAGVLTGKGGGRLDPTGTATRAEIAAIMQRCCEGIFAK